MNQRLNIYQEQPEALQGMLTLEQWIAQSALSKREVSLVKLRASQINGCLYCIQMHVHEAVKAGESEQRLHQVVAWRKASVFSDEERILLLLTEEMTTLSDEGIREESYEKALELLGEQKLIAAIMTITVINAWNRIAIATKLH
ncbi:Alkyl hydroperoxide reductase AhpD [Tenacibaculum litopenaei]|uniref:carboxymuconolactone decarboxylase family protein n=1 Tax=Tenacibaculum litopenaei TaxID=396016 RepID=UPI0038963FDF